MALVAGDDAGRPPPIPAAGGGRAPAPQIIGHRGYKAAFPENSMAAFQGAVEVGAHAIETDLHLSRDGVVVLSHDASLKRCFGKDEKIADCDWDYLSTLRTVRKPHVSMPRLADLLEWLTLPGIESIWLLLDIKTDDDADALVSAIARTIAAAPPSPSRPWKERIVIGAWNGHYLTLARHRMPGHRLAFIGFSPLYARKFLPGGSCGGAHDANNDVDFNLWQPSLVGPLGARFRAAARAAGRSVYVWTVDDERWMEWSVRKGLDGVVTDDPLLMRKVCERMAGRCEEDDEKEEEEDSLMKGKAKRFRFGGDAVRVGRWGRGGWFGAARAYFKAAFMQAVSMVAVALLWRRLDALGKKKSVPVPVPVAMSMPGKAD